MSYSPIAPQNAAQQLGLQWALDAAPGKCCAGVKKNLGLGIVFFPWPNGHFMGKKPASLRHPVWSMMDGTLKHSPWFSTAQDLGPGRIWRTSIEKGDAQAEGFPKKLRNSSLSLRSGLGWRCFDHWYSSYNGKQLRGLSCSWQLCLSRRLQMFPDSRSYMTTLWIKHMDEMDMAQNKTHK